MVNPIMADSIKSGSCEQYRGGRGREGTKEEEVEQETKERKEKNIQKLERDKW